MKKTGSDLTPERHSTDVPQLVGVLREGTRLDTGNEVDAAEDQTKLSLKNALINTVGI